MYLKEDDVGKTETAGSILGDMDAGESYACLGVQQTHTHLVDSLGEALCPKYKHRH